MPRLAFSILSLFFACIIIGLQASPAHAIQVHPAPEGFYIHQAGHILFLAAMLGFSYKIHRSVLATQKGWRYIIYGALCLAFWNCWAFSGHIVTLFVSQNTLISNSGSRQSVFLANSSLDVAHYILKMDHFFCVPALIFLYLGLRHLLAASEVAHHEVS